MKPTIPVYLFGAFIVWITGSTGTYLPHLTESCYSCICYIATKCEEGRGCVEGFCGPFELSKGYWADAGMAVLPKDDPERDKAWEDCATNYQCAKRIIQGYLERFGKDCNGDGVTDCFDYIMVHGNGGYGCSTPLNQTNTGKQILKRYERCSV